MRRIVLVAATAAALAGCGSSGSGPGSDTSGARLSPAPTGKILFDEVFDEDTNHWGVADNPDYGTASFGGGDYVWKLKGRVAHILPEVLGKQYDAGTLDTRNVVVRASVTIDSGRGVAGVFCREVKDTDADFQWYEFVARDGFAAIRRADTEGNLDVLAKTTKVTLPAGRPITFEAACVDSGGKAHLVLRLNGTAALSATDDHPLGNGVPGLQSWTFPAHAELDLRWHDFSIRRANG